MHTAHQLDRSQFSVRLGSAPADADAILPGWGPLDRLGVVVHEPFGALGAGHLIQLSIALFYDARPGRRPGADGNGGGRPVYPEIYLFHVGEWHGDHSYFDFWPARKETLVADRPREILDAVNDRGVTRLAVPAGTPRPVEHEYNDLAAAHDRVVSAFAYSATGRVEHGDVEIEGLDAVTEFNVEKILDPDAVAAGIVAGASDRPPAPDPDLDARRWTTHALTRTHEARPGLATARARRQALRSDGRAAESYRRITVDEALALLARGGV